MGKVTFELEVEDVSTAGVGTVDSEEKMDQSAERALRQSGLAGA